MPTGWGSSHYQPEDREGARPTLLGPADEVIE
jgi:hypothetical protein